MPTEYWIAVLEKARAKKTAKAQRRGAVKRKKRKRRGFAKNISQWRQAVMERDDYTCQDCGTRRRKGNHAHHIKMKSERPELRLYVKNGVTLCRDCHNIRHDGLLDYYSDQIWLREVARN